MMGWTREFKSRCNPYIQVHYDCTSEASEEEWEDDTRDDDATIELASERLKQKQVAAPRL